VRLPGAMSASGTPETDSEPDPRFLRRVALATACGEGLDGHDLGIISVVLLSVSRDLGVSPVWVGLIGASSLIGTFIGGPLFGVAIGAEYAIGSPSLACPALAPAGCGDQTAGVASYTRGHMRHSEQRSLRGGGRLGRRAPAPPRLPRRPARRQAVRPGRARRAGPLMRLPGADCGLGA
jgi:hypothetical protein